MRERRKGEEEEGGRHEALFRGYSGAKAGF